MLVGLLITPFHATLLADNGRICLPNQPTKITSKTHSNFSVVASDGKGIKIILSACAFWSRHDLITFLLWMAVAQLWRSRSQSHTKHCNANSLDMYTVPYQPFMAHDRIMDLCILCDDLHIWTKLTLVTTLKVKAPVSVGHDTDGNICSSCLCNILHTCLSFSQKTQYYVSICVCGVGLYYSLQSSYQWTLLLIYDITWS